MVSFFHCVARLYFVVMDLISHKGLETDQNQSDCFSEVKVTQKPTGEDSCSMKDNSVNTKSNSMGSCHKETKPSPSLSASQLPAFYSNSHSYVVVFITLHFVGSTTS